MWRKYLVVVGLLALVSCAGNSPNVTTVATPLGPALLQSSEGSTSIRVGGKDYPLNGFRSVDILGFMGGTGSQIMLISGATSSCAKKYAVLSVIGQNADVFSIGNCGESYVFGGDGSNVFITQTNAEDPKIWALQNGKFSGPILRSELYETDKSKNVKRSRYRHR